MEMALRRVLYITDLDPSKKFGSLEEQIFILARAFDEQGSLFLPLFRKPPAGKTRTSFEDSALQVEWADLRSFTLGTARYLDRIIRRSKIEIIHWNFYHPLNPYVWALSLTHPKVVHYFTEHNPRPVDNNGKAIDEPVPLIKKFLKRCLLKRYAKVLCVSKFVQQGLECQGAWPELSCSLHFINTDRFSPDPSHRNTTRERVTADSHFVALVVARLNPEKGVTIAIKALQHVNERVVLWVVGDGKELGTLTRLTEELSLEDRVRFFGPQPEVSGFMQAADCLVVPSTCGEAAGLVVLEGMATGLPVVASNVGGIPEYLDNGRVGFLFPPGDDRRLADILTYLETRPDLCGDIGNKARSIAVNRFSVHSRLNDYLNLYRG